MGKLHELVAVEKDVRGTSQKILEETMVTFSKKAHLFSTHSKLYEPLNDTDPERPDEEHPQPITTIGEKLKYFEGQLSRLFDIVLQKEDANTKAREDIVIHTDEGATTIATKVPVAALVQFENLLDQVRTRVYDSIPTLDPAKNWSENKAAGAGYYKTDVTTRQSTRKVSKPLVLHPGTDKHPPQVQMVTEDVPVGTWKITNYSGLVSPAEKSSMLKRIDLLLEAVKKARSRANDTAVEGLKIGKALFKYINEGK